MIELYLQAHRMIQEGASTGRVDSMLASGRLQSQVMISLKNQANEDQDKQYYAFVAQLDRALPS